MDLPDGYSIVSERCMYQADVGLICPISYQKNEQIFIKPFFLLDNEMQNIVVVQLEKEWKDINHDFIDKNWSQGGDQLYVAYASKYNIIGTVAIDRKGFIPFISTLFICHIHRGFGYSKTLISFAETFIKYILKFEESRLWCNQNMLDFYFNLGYYIESMTDDKYILLKKLI